MHEILQIKHWAMDEDVFNRLSAAAIALLKNGKSLDRIIEKYTLEELPDKRYSMSVSFDPSTRLLVGTAKNQSKVAVIPVLGGLTKRGGMCSYGMKDYMQMVKTANEANHITAIVLDIESPGGSADGTPEFGKVVKESGKPIVSFGDHHVASAAYWIASQSSEIIANENNTTIFGSIGAYYAHINQQKLIENKIGSVEIIRAPQSSQKALINPIEPLTDELRGVITAELKEVTENFIKAVKTGRGDRLDESAEGLFEGKTYPAKQAKKIGLIDSLGTLQTAIDRASTLARSVNNSVNNSNPNTNMSLFKRLGLSLSLANKLSEQELENLQSAEERLAETERENASLTEQTGNLTQQVSDLTAERDQLQETVAEHETTITDLNGQLEEAPAGNPSTAVTDGDPTDPEEDPKKKYETSADREMAQIKSNFNLN
jgi:protease-4